MNFILKCFEYLKEAARVPSQPKGTLVLPNYLERTWI